MLCTELMLLSIFSRVFTMMPVMMFNVLFNVEIQLIQVIQVMQVDKCRIHCNDVSVCVYNDASYEG